MISGAVFLGIVLLYLRHLGRPLRFAGGGLAVLVLFVTIRAASFHHIDALLHTGDVGVGWAHLLQLRAIAVIGASAGWRAR